MQRSDARARARHRVRAFAKHMNLATFEGRFSQKLRPGDAGVQQTIRLMRDVIDAGVTDPDVNTAAVRILQYAGVQNFDRVGKLKALYEAVSWPNFLYVEDPVGPFGPKETIRTARTLLKLRAGDCDDYTILLASLAGSIGIRTHAVTVAADPSAPDEFSHIYPEAEVNPGEWIALDAARPGAEFGKPAHLYFRKRVWSFEDNSYHDLAGTMASPKFRRNSPPRILGLGSYALVRGLGDDSTDVSAADISAIGQATANILAAAQGSPYGTFQTAYSPVAPAAGYAAAAPYITPGSSSPFYGAGYPAGQQGVSILGSNAIWWILGIAAAAMALRSVK